MYDAFWVYVSPFVFGGASVMVAVGQQSPTPPSVGPGNSDVATTVSLQFQVRSDMFTRAIGWFDPDGDHRSSRTSWLCLGSIPMATVQRWGWATLSSLV